tara:strand:- start:4916 stop:5509 length:594 start_codon:yes stop_codon:yes gene_type:complete
MNIILSNELLDKFELKNQDFLVDKNYYDLKSGQQEYRLYSYLSTLFNNITILDIGTLNGRSAISLSHNENNKVISYDIRDGIKNLNHKIYTKSNIEFRIKNVLDDLNKEFIKNIKIIMIDIDHFYIIEKMIIDKLKELEYDGIILLDDIIHPSPKEFEAMQKLWNEIQDEKYDITKYGHWSGTGLINLSKDIKFILE